MKILCNALILFLLFSGHAWAWPVFCTNCSNSLLQSLERVTNVQKLATLMQEYQEAVSQTAAQLEMVQQNIQQYRNMVQNTVQLPSQLVRKISGELAKVARITGTLNTMRNDVVGLGKIHDSLYQAQGDLKKLVDMPRSMLEQGGQTYQTSWDNWSRRVDESTRATFQLSGQQLKDMEDSGELEIYINELLSTPDGQQKAIMAGNQLAALQIQEARQLRELLATKIQSDLASQEKAEKARQMDQEMERQMGKKMLGTGSRSDPF